jgi:hypothetical protein
VNEVQNCKHMKVPGAIGQLGVPPSPGLKSAPRILSMTANELSPSDPILAT